jgi:hypothetical protein
MPVTPLPGRVRGRRTSRYVPEELVEEVEQAVAHGRQLQELIQEMGQRYLAALKREWGVGRRLSARVKM